LISILAVNPDLLNIASISFIFFFTEGHLKNRCCIVSSFKQNIKPKCQIKWEEQYGGNIDWTQIWTKLKKIKVTNKVKECQWKCLHNINYTEPPFKTFMKFSGIAFFYLRKL
jgi:hypothetical protein